ncbi:MAG: SAM-dependent chlorinase/fluorinase [Candidatus Omnitrophica bacterium]|nr:SAM-dependent chlorinase/fluorinase [Candidatus Omnitrophota bacterium]
MPSMKGIILGIHPRAQLVDISHELQRGDVRRASFLWSSVHSCFPSGTIHVGVVDPGVGTLRRLLAVLYKDHVYLGPDNGIMTHLLAEETFEEAYEIRPSKLSLTEISDTFHGRDILAPVAAKICKGTALSHVGTPAQSLRKLKLPQAKFRGKTEIEGAIEYIDHFGNAVSNIHTKTLLSLWPQEEWKNLSIQVARRKLHGILASYSSVNTGTPLALIGSVSLLEIAVRDGHGAQKLSLKIGTPIRITHTPPWTKK